MTTERDVDPDLAWSPDGSRVIFGLEVPETRRQLLCEFDPAKNDPPTVLEGIDHSLRYRCCCFTPDGRWIIVQTSQ